MPLSDHEQRVLAEIESAITEQDPKFAARVNRAAVGGRINGRMAKAAGLFVCGVLTMLAGAAFAPGIVGLLLVVSISGFLMMFVGAVYAITGPNRFGTGGRRQ